MPTSYRILIFFILDFSCWNFIWKWKHEVINKTASISISRNVLRKVSKMINASNSAQRRAASSNLYEEVFSSATEHAEEFEHNVDVILQPGSGWSPTRAYSRLIEQWLYHEMSLSYKILREKKKTHSVPNISVFNFSSTSTSNTSCNLFSVSYFFVFFAGWFRLSLR